MVESRTSLLSGRSGYTCGRNSPELTEPSVNQDNVKNDNYKNEKNGTVQISARPDDNIREANDVIARPVKSAADFREKYA